MDVDVDVDVPYPLSKEYIVNHEGNPDLCQAIFLDSTILGSLALPAIHPLLGIIIWYIAPISWMLEDTTPKP